MFRWMQVAKGTHDLDANLALLRFYQYQPSIAKPATITKVSSRATPIKPRPSNPRNLVAQMGFCSSRMRPVAVSEPGRSCVPSAGGEVGITEKHERAAVTSVWSVEQIFDEVAVRCSQILLKALMDLPEPNFMLCIHLVPVNLPKVQRRPSQPPIRRAPR